MNTENEINEEVRQLLDSLEEHGKNARQQKELGDLIDRLANNESGTVSSLRGTKQSTLVEKGSSARLLRSARNDAKRRKLYPLWWVMGAAAACLLLWLLIKPNAKQQPEMEQEILVEETKAVDTVKTEVPEVILEAPVAEEELLAAETTNETEKSESGLLRSSLPRNDVQEKHKNETIQEQLLAENTTTEPLESPKPTDTANIGSNHTPTESETPSAVQKPQRRVIRSLNLVCYECQKDPEFFTKPVMEDRTLFGQPQDPYMKNGSLAFEIKLN